MRRSVQTQQADLKQNNFATTESRQSNRSSAIALYDITIPCDGYELNTVLKFCREFCKRWNFQLEKDANGHDHYQCRVSLNIKKRLDSMINWISKEYPGWQVRPGHHLGNLFYFVKTGSYWSDKNDIDEDKIPLRFRGEITWRPWQQKVLDMINNQAGDGYVDVLIDKGQNGGNGKSFLTLYLGCRGLASYVPCTLGTEKCIARFVMNTPKFKAYFFDLPFATSHKCRVAMFNSASEIKTGYHFNGEYFDPPHVWVFTNKNPPVSLLSTGNWRFWSIKNNELGRLIPTGTYYNDKYEEIIF